MALLEQHHEVGGPLRQTLQAHESLALAAAQRKRWHGAVGAGRGTVRRKAQGPQRRIQIGSVDEALVEVKIGVERVAEGAGCGCRRGGGDRGVVAHAGA